MNASSNPSTPHGSRDDNPLQDDRAADRLTFIWLAVFLTAALCVDVLSRATELGRDDGGEGIGKYLIYETTGYYVMLALFPIVALTASRATPGQRSWRFVVPFHLIASMIVSLLHVGIFVALRKVIFWLVYSGPYIFTNNVLRDLVYEYRKDLLTYSLFLFFIIFGRQLAQQRRELAAAREDARATKRLTLKCGGRNAFVEASDIRWVKSASNYVEVATPDKTHLARSTLAAIERQLADAGAQAIRVHRSYVINAEHIREITPTGEGDVKIEMSDGAIIPGSRRYRDRLPVGN